MAIKSKKTMKSTKHAVTQKKMGKHPKTASTKAGSKRAGPKAPKPLVSKMISKIKGAKLKDIVMYDIPHYPQTEDFTSSAACAMMVLKHIDDDFKFKRDAEFNIWQEAVSGSVWYGSKYGLAYALAKRGASTAIMSNIKDEGYERKLAVYENVNLDTLSASFNEIKEKAKQMNISEEYMTISLQTIKKALSTKHLPIVLIDAKVINPYLESLPHWVVVKGYDKDNFYINDPYSDSTITIDSDVFKSALGFEDNYHMIVVDATKK